MAGKVGDRILFLLTSDPEGVVGISWTGTEEQTESKPTLSQRGYGTTPFDINI
jgi:hypothetical protein